MLKKLLHRKEEPSEPKPEQPTIDLTDLEKLILANDADVINAIQSEARLRERMDSLLQHMRRMPKRPLELTEEKILRRQKLDGIVGLMRQELRKREQQKRRDQYKQEKAWNKDNVNKLLPNVRYCTRDVKLLMSKQLDLDVMAWRTPESAIIKVAGKEFNLNSIHPTKWKEMIDFKFHPVFVRMRGKAMRDGKTMGKWRHGNETYEENKRIKIGAEVIIAIMLV